MSSQNFILIIIFNYIITHYIIIVHSQQFDTCDCSNPVTIGLLNLSETSLCSSAAKNPSKINVKYQIFRYNAADNSGPGYVCMKWKSTKKIVGYFFRSFDTTYDKTEIPMTKSECWDMVEKLSCPDPITGSSNPMSHDGDTWSYIKNPEGEPLYMQEVTYTEFNCVLQKIEVRQDCIDCEIQSSIGLLSKDSKSVSVTHGHSTIIWNSIRFQPESYPCDASHVHAGNGKLSTANKQGIASLNDDENQLLFTFTTDRLTCQGLTDLDFYTITGIANTYIVLNRDYSEFILNRHEAAERIKLSNKLMPELKNSTAAQLRREAFFNEKLQELTKPAENVVTNPKASVERLSNLRKRENQAHRQLRSMFEEMFLHKDSIMEHEVIIQSIDEVGQITASKEYKIPHNGTICTFHDPDLCITYNPYLNQFTLEPPLSLLRATQHFVHFKRKNYIYVLNACIVKTIYNQLQVGACISNNNPLSIRYEYDSHQLVIIDRTAPIESCIGYSDKHLIIHYCDITDPSQKWLWNNELLDQLNTNNISQMVQNDRELENFKILKNKLQAYEQKTLARINKERDDLVSKARHQLAQEIEQRNATFHEKWKNETEEYKSNLHRAYETDHENLLQWAQLFKDNLTLDFELQLANISTIAQLEADRKISELRDQQHLEYDLLKNQMSQQLKTYIEREQICSEQLIQCSASDSPTAQPLTEDQPSTTLSDFLYVQHHVFMEERNIERENTLASEINNVYCQLRKTQKLQIFLLAQTSGIIAANALNIKPKCSRINTIGENLLLQQCAVKPTTFVAKKTACGYEPFSNGNTIAKDGYSLIPFQSCYWKGNFATFNGETHQYLNETWIRVEPSIKVDSLKLIDKFQTPNDQELNYLMHMHSAHAIPQFDSINLVGEITAHLTSQSTHSLSPIVQNYKNNDFFSWTSNWLRNIKIAIISLVGLLIIIPTTIALIKICIKSKTLRINKVEIIDSDQPPEQIPLQTTNNANESHKHTRLVYDRVRGYLWNDGCAL